MSFVSPTYYLFLFTVCCVYFLVNLKRRIYVLLIASYIFYFSYDYRYIGFILITTVVSYAASLVMDKTKKQYQGKLALAVALATEIGMLFFTKYWNPLAESTGWLNPINILVPLGISFYTFQTIGYLFDVYRKQISAEKNFTNYALFLSFFPHLLAGPIEPAQSFFSQLYKAQTFNKKFAAFGIMLIIIGLFKKLVIADRISQIVNLVFENPDAYKGLAVGFSLFLSRYQIYCDFSGYTDIALGSAQIFGINLTQNFNQPFFATSITEYWKRWHISLGNWIRAYIFYPLVATPLARIGVHGLIIVTFLILGLWHGGTINFLIYGVWHGVFIVIDTKTKNWRIKKYKLIGLNTESLIFKILCGLATVLLIVVPSTLFFRSTNLYTTAALLNNVITPWSFENIKFILNDNNLSLSLTIALIGITLMETVHIIIKKHNIKNWLWEKSSFIFILALGTALAGILAFGNLSAKASFIYTKF